MAVSIATRLTGLFARSIEIYRGVVATRGT
jgi:hypothetical protein